MSWAPPRQDTDGCWLWQGGKTTAGYGTVRDPDSEETVYVHRASYEAYVGPIPEGYTIDHLCRVHNCYNPAHLEAVTQAENNLRAAVIKTHCPKGHPHVGPPIPGKKRRCAECHRQQERERHHNNRDSMNAKRRERHRRAKESA